MSTPQVSVVIPTHNRGEFLHSAIRSVLHQTYQNFELIVVDDGSKDKASEGIVADFHDDRIKYYRHEVSRGGSAARNTGIRNSSGAYVAFLDDDDEWLPEKLSKQISVLAASGPEVGGIYSGRFTVDRYSGKILDEHHPTKRGRLDKDLLVENCIGGASAVILKKSCLEKVGAFDETLPCSQDYDLWLRVASEYLIECVQEPLFNYYVHQNQIGTNLDALARGLELIVKKYCSFPVQKKYYSTRYLDLGVMRCLTHDLRGGRSDFMKALQLYPMQFRGYINLCMTFAGAENFRRIKDAKNRVVALVRGRRIFN